MTRYAAEVGCATATSTEKRVRSAAICAMLGRNRGKDKQVSTVSEEVRDYSRR